MGDPKSSHYTEKLLGLLARALILLGSDGKIQHLEIVKEISEMPNIQIS